MFSLLTFFFLPLLGSMNQANFPHVLSEEEEKKLLLRYKENDMEARTELIEHNLRLVAHIVKKFENIKTDREDLLSIGTLGLIKAVDTYHFDSGARLATYASRCIENEILMHLRSIKKEKDVVSLYTPIGDDKDGNEIRICDVLEDPSESITEQLLKKEYYDELHKALNTLNEQELDIILRRFGLMDRKLETQKSIAKSLGISRSYVSRIEKRALTKLYLILKDKRM